MVDVEVRLHQQFLSSMLLLVHKFLNQEIIMSAKFLTRPVVSPLLSRSYPPLCRRYASMQSYEHLLVSNPKPGVTLSTKPASYSPRQSPIFCTYADSTSAYSNAQST